MTTRTPLTWKHFPAGQDGFFRSPVLLAGATEAVLVNGGFTLSDGKAMLDAIAAGDKQLKTIYVSQSDPDYYFSLGPIHAAFPRGTGAGRLRYARGNRGQCAKEDRRLGTAIEGKRSAKP